MGALFNILTHSFGSLCIGFLITAICIALMFYIIKSWYKNSSFTPISYIIGCTVFVFIVFHAIIICGAVVIKGYGDNVESLVNSYVRQIPSDAIFSQNDTQKILDHLRDDLPLVGYYASYADFSGHSPADIAESMNDELQWFMNKYIARHFLWALFFVLLGAFGIVKSMEIVRPKKSSAHHSRTKFYDE